MTARLAAVRSVVAVLSHGDRLDRALTRACSGLDTRDRALAHEISYGVLRWYLRLDQVVAQLVHRPLPARDLDVKVLLAGAMYEILYLRVPDHAAVSEAVESTRALGKPWAAKLVNALLRRFQRERDTLLARAAATPEGRFSHPAWLVAALQRDWPEDWSAILDRFNERPPMDLRVNLRHGSADAYAARLAKAGIAASRSPISGSGIRLEAPVTVDALPGFAAGDVTVQDLGAQLAGPLLGAQPGHRVLDACAAPGGKAGHILELEPGVESLTVLDTGADRIALLTETLRRLGASARILDADATATGTWWDGQPFDRILLDAPCSSSGVVRRHPDIRFRRREAQIAEHEKLQSALLEALWPTLAPGGRLLYVTCSLFQRENDARIENLVRGHRDAHVVPIQAIWGAETGYGRQTLPSRDDTDGFYYALVERH